MRIGELANRTGHRASAIRYYEKLGLLAAPHRTGGQRRYGEEAVHRALLIAFASNMGFTLDEIKLFLNGLRATAAVGPRWRTFARRKIKEVEKTVERARRLKSLLEHLLDCRCASLEVCVERLRLSPRLRFILSRADRRPVAGSRLRRAREICRGCGISSRRCTQTEKIIEEARTEHSGRRKPSGHIA
jgi:MerR family transcriptional regulator, redox-sensitive transcriptional activator SoxR